VEDTQIHQRLQNGKEVIKCIEIYEMDSTSNRVHLLRLIMQERLSEGGDGHVNKMHELFQNLLALAIEMKPEFFMCGTMLTILSSN